MPFVQGQLRQEYISALIETECAHCKQPMHIDFDSDLKYNVHETDARPLFFAPLGAIRPGDKSIIDGF